MSSFHLFKLFSLFGFQRPWPLALPLSMTRSAGFLAKQNNSHQQYNFSYSYFSNSHPNTNSDSVSLLEILIWNIAQGSGGVIIPEATYVALKRHRLVGDLVTLGSGWTFSYLNDSMKIKDKNWFCRLEDKNQCQIEKLQPGNIRTCRVQELIRN